MPLDGESVLRQHRVLLNALQAVATAASGLEPYMAGHPERVARYSDRLGRALGLSDEERFLLSVTAWLHDIGNLSTPAYILRKPSFLAEDEMEEIRVHPVRGAEVFSGFPGLMEVASAVRHHHERYDGTGYPDGLRGDEIPLFSRIVLVAETYEAMTHDRPYRRAMSHAEAVRRLRESAGSQLDPHLVGQFLELLQSGDER